MTCCTKLTFSVFTNPHKGEHQNTDVKFACVTTARNAQNLTKHERTTNRWMWNNNVPFDANGIDIMHRHWKFCSNREQVRTSNPQTENVKRWKDNKTRRLFTTDVLTCIDQQKKPFQTSKTKTNLTRARLPFFFSQSREPWQAATYWKNIVDHPAINRSLVVRIQKYFQWQNTLSTRTLLELSHGHSWKIICWEFI